MSPEQALISATLLSKLNRGLVMLVDRAFKEGYDSVRKTPHMLDTLMRAYFTSYFAENGGARALRELVQFYKANDMGSLAVDAKNQLIIVSKENLANVDNLIEGELGPLIEKLMQVKNGEVVRNHAINGYLANYMIGNVKPEIESGWLLRGDDTPLEEDLKKCILDKKGYIDYEMIKNQ